MKLQSTTQGRTSRALWLRFPTWGHAVGIVAVVMLLLAGCADGGGEPGDDFLVSFPSPLEIFIQREGNRPFGVLEVGVTPFVTPGIGSEPYVLGVSGIAFADGVEIVFEAQDDSQTTFLDPLGERVIDVLLVCDCFIDFVILRTSFGDTVFTFE